VQTDSC